MAEAAQRGELSESELEVLKALWQAGSGTVRRVNEMLERRGRRWAYTTVLTLLQRLQAKGWVASDTSGPAHVFRPTATRDEWLDTQLEALAAQASDGNSAPLVLALVGRTRFTAKQLADFRKLIDQLESDQKRRP